VDITAAVSPHHDFSASVGSSLLTPARCRRPVDEACGWLKPLTASPQLPPCRCRGCRIGVDQPLAPAGDSRLGTMPASLLSRVGLASVTAPFTPDHKPHMSRGGAAERHRRGGRGFHALRAHQIGKAADPVTTGLPLKCLLTRVRQHHRPTFCPWCGEIGKTRASRSRPKRNL
jgi:hypothetical protein